MLGTASDAVSLKKVTLNRALAKLQCGSAEPVRLFWLANWAPSREIPTDI